MVHWRQLQDGRWEYLGTDGNWYPNGAATAAGLAPPPLQPSSRSGVPDRATVGLLGLGGAALVVAGALLPWVNVAGLGDRTLNLFQLGPIESFSKFGTVLVLIGIVVALIGAARLALPTLSVCSSIASIILGIAAMAIAVDRYNLLSTTLAQHPDAHTLVGASLAYGPWIVIVGGVLAIVSGLAGQKKGCSGFSVGDALERLFALSRPVPCSIR